jgi:hypothetical protein
MKNFMLASVLVVVARVAQLDGSTLEFACFGMLGTLTMIKSIEGFLGVQNGG